MIHRYGTQPRLLILLNGKKMVPPAGHVTDPQHMAVPVVADGDSGVCAGDGAGVPSPAERLLDDAAGRIALPSATCYVQRAWLYATAKRMVIQTQANLARKLCGR
jgi:hypothetical protein